MRAGQLSAEHACRLRARRSRRNEVERQVVTVEVMHPGNRHSLVLFVGLAKPREPSGLEREYPGIGTRASFDEGTDVVSTPSAHHTITT
jgi:hypothetical protein